MLYHLLYPLRVYFFGFNLFGYITFRAASAAIAALLFTFLIGPAILRWLRRREIGEEIREDGPQTHRLKAGTPTMGGLIILPAILIPVLLFARLNNIYILLMTGATLWMGGVGFLDDWLKAVKKYPKGLVGRYKLAGQITWGLIVGLTVTLSGDFSPLCWSTAVPFFKDLMINFGWFYIPMVIFVITATSNAVNLTDGLDGLAIGLVAIATLAWAGISYVSGHATLSHYLQIQYFRGSGELTVYCAALIGAALGFLWYNSHPASVFMGDTGALALGGAMGTMAVLLKKELLLPVVCGVFMAEALSVIVQVWSFKLRGKRVFKMAPIHHHYELLGWPEEKVVTRFWIVGILFALITLATFKVR
ncbi:MAG TPA: phospho-N-acetylmuramoyl-pentapeptide-transferase [bacterium]|nr:phospho-N-acetylmuramoyl-pentapeptide-transferase [bacterium]